MSLFGLRKIEIEPGLQPEKIGRDRSSERNDGTLPNGRTEFRTICWVSGWRD